MPTRADGYVFPVGGGPGAVSVGRHHHDYPAADIAAPLGAPLYALADGIVLSVVDDGRCGTGFVLQTLDGLEWVYCHLSYRDPGLGEGLLVSAGQWVGLVGSTGHSTGPHLHLGLRPDALPAGDAVVPGVRRDRLHVAGRGRRDRVPIDGRCSRSCRPRSLRTTSSNSHSRGVEFVPASAEGRGMTAGVIGRLPRVGLIVCAIGLVTGTLAFAATSTLSTPTTSAAAPVAAKPEPLVVPDVRKQAYVFAKGSLEQSGFAWRVEGVVPGFAANVVVAQSPAPGARVIADGAPIIVLRLSRNGSYEQEGVPENVSPYAGKRARLVGAAQPKRTTAAARRLRRRSGRRRRRSPRPRRKRSTLPAEPARPRSRSPARRPSRSTRSSLSVRAKRLAAWVE